MNFNYYLCIPKMPLSRIASILKVIPKIMPEARI